MAQTKIERNRKLFTDLQQMTSNFNGRRMGKVNKWKRGKKYLKLHKNVAHIHSMHKEAHKIREKLPSLQDKLLIDCFLNKQDSEISNIQAEDKNVMY